MMKLILLTVVAIAMTGCYQGPMGNRGLDGKPGIGAPGNDGAPGLDGSNGTDGANGSDGVNGSNGHSMAAETTTPSTLICPDGGSQVDFYIDLDDSASVTAGDTFQAASVACNGSNGLDGLNGSDGVNGTDGADGQDGADGNDGQDGEDGEDSTVAGPQGEPGTPGTNGTNGSGATIVAFSPTACTLISTGFYAKSFADNVWLYTASTCSTASKYHNVSNSNPLKFIGTNIVVMFYLTNSITVVTFN